MIELPEAITIAAQMTATLAGKHIRSAVANSSPHKFAFYTGDPSAYASQLVGQELGPARAGGNMIHVPVGSRLNLVLGEGNARFAVDPRGFCKPAYYMDENLGDCRDLRAAWASPLLRSVRALEFLPESCSGCFYAGKCRGGSRHAARLACGDWRAPDPLSRAAVEL